MSTAKRLRKAKNAKARVRRKAREAAFGARMVEMMSDPEMKAAFVMAKVVTAVVKLAWLEPGAPPDPPLCPKTCELFAPPA